MKKEKKDDLDIPEVDFSKARRVTPAETEMFRKAIENTFGIARPPRGRPPKKAHLKYRDIHLKIHPRALLWAKAKAKKEGVGYQTVINETLLKHAA